MTLPKKPHLPQRYAIAVLAMVCISLVLVLAKPPRSSDEDNLWGAWLSVAAKDITSIRMRPAPDLASHNCGTISDPIQITERTTIQHVYAEMRGVYPLSSWFKGVKHWKATDIFYLDFIMHDQRSITFVITLEKDGMTAGYHLETQSRRMYVSEPLRGLLLQARSLTQVPSPSPRTGAQWEHNDSAGPGPGLKSVISVP